MKKWIIPIVEILIFCVILGILTVPMSQFKSYYRNENKKRKIQEEENLAYDLNAKWEESPKEIVDIQTGRYYTAILKQDGTVWIAGVNYSYTSDNTYYGIQKNRFTKMNLENVKQIAVGRNFALALTKNGEVYSWGANEYSQLGRNNGSKKPNQIPKKLDIENIEKIYVFGEQAAALSYDKTAYYWGYAVEEYNKKEIKTMEQKVNEIYLVQNQYYFKTIQDEIYAVGFDFEGITDQQNGWAREPVKIGIENVEKIVSFEGYEQANSANRIYVIKKDGTLWLLNTKGGTLQTQIQGLSNIKEIYPYKSNSDMKYSFLALDNQGNLYKKTGDYLEQEVIKNVEDVQVYEGTIIIKKNDETLWNCGYSINTMKSNYTGWVQYYQTPMRIRTNQVKQFSISENFMLVVDTNNQLYKHGLNNKGQLGGGEDKDCQDLSIVEELQEVVTDPSMDTIAD